jgi:chromosome segregation ATPase
MVGISIKTGADKLVELVSEKKKISVDDAAKKLGVNKTVVEEWAEFLEEEGVVSLEYSLSKIWITERKITKEDIIKGASEVISEKDALSRKIDVAISALQKDTAGFDTIKKEFDNIQGNIKDEISVVKKELSELERYDSLRKNLDKDIAKQKQNYQSYISDAESKLKQESQKYDELKSTIDKEKRNVELYLQKLEELKKLKSEYEKTVSSLKDSIEKIEDTLYSYKGRFEDSSKVISRYKSSLEDLEKELSDRKNSNITKKFEELKSGQEKIMKSQFEMSTELKKKISTMKSISESGGKIKGVVNGFFTKNINTEKLIKEIENDRTDLTKEYQSLKDKVEKFTLISVHSNLKGEMKDLESKLKELEKKKSSITLKLEKLISLIKGK